MPEWQPRFICFEYTSDLPRVGAAAGNAEGFLTRPSLHRFRGTAAAEGSAAPGAGHRRVRSRWSTSQIPRPPDALAEALSTEDLPEQVRVRREKLDRLRERGIDPYPVTYPRTHTLAQVRAQAGELPPDTRTGQTAAIAGRVLLKRDTGKLSFATLRDGYGDLQVMVALDNVGPEVLEHWKRDVDLGDHVGVTGEIITTRRGELTVLASSFAITSKCAAPAAGQAQGPHRPRGPGPLTLRRPDRPARGARDRLHALDDRGQRARLAARPRLHRGRDADAAADPRRRERAALRDPHQRLRHGPLPADRHRAAPQAADRRRHGEGVRDRPPVPQRRSGLQAQPGVHLVGGVRDLRRLQHHAGADPADHPGSRHGGLRLSRSPGVRTPTARSPSTTSPATGRSRRSARRSPRHWARRSPSIPRVEVLHQHARRSASSSSPTRSGAICWRRSTANCARARPRLRSSTPTSRRRTRR